VRPDGVVVLAAAFDQHLRLLQRVEDLAVEQLVAQQCRDPAIAVAAILGCQLDDRCGQRRLIIRVDKHLTLRRAVLAEHATGSPFADVETVAHPINAKLRSKRPLGCSGFADLNQSSGDACDTCDASFLYQFTNTRAKASTQNK